jgi:hypothetical protein
MQTNPKEKPNQTIDRIGERNTREEDATRNKLENPPARIDPPSDCVAIARHVAPRVSVLRHWTLVTPPPPRLCTAEVLSGGGRI